MVGAWATVLSLNIAMKNFIIGALIITSTVLCWKAVGFKNDLNAISIYKYKFCEECCWKNSFGGHTIYTCSDSKTELWRKVH